MVVNGWRVNGTILKYKRWDGVEAWTAAFTGPADMFLNSLLEDAHITEQDGTSYRAGVGVVRGIQWFDGKAAVDVASCTALVEWEGAE